MFYKIGIKYFIIIIEKLIYQAQTNLKFNTFDVKQLDKMLPPAAALVLVAQTMRPR